VAVAGSTGKGQDKILFVDLTWIDNSNNEDNFIVQRTIETGLGNNKLCENFASIYIAGVNTTNYRDPTVVSGNTYCYQIRAQNGDGTSEPSNVAKVRLN